MTMVKNSNIAVIGDSDLTNLLRLAGIGRYTVIENTETVGNDVRAVLDELIDEPGISIIAIQADYAKYARDIIDRVLEEKRLTPVIIEVPSKSAEGQEDAAGYYRSFVRKFVGFDIEI